MKVQNIRSARSGEAVKNQFIIYDNGKIVFQSYNSLIAEWDGERLTLGRDFDYSVTTSKYLRIWLQDNVPHQLYYEICTAPGSSFSKQLWWMIDNDRISYNCMMV